MSRALEKSAWAPRVAAIISSVVVTVIASGLLRFGFPPENLPVGAALSFVVGLLYLLVIRAIWRIE